MTANLLEQALWKMAEWTQAKLGVGIAFGTAVGLLGMGCQSTPRPQPAIYDTQANGSRQLEEALLLASNSHRRVLLNLGANWCGDSQKMYRRLLEHPRITPIVRSNYVMVLVDINNRSGAQRNEAVMERLEIPFDTRIPVLLVLAADGRVLNSDPSERLADSDHRHPRKVARYLTKWGHR